MTQTTSTTTKQQRLLAATTIALSGLAIASGFTAKAPQTPSFASVRSASATATATFLPQRTLSGFSLRVSVAEGETPSATSSDDDDDNCINLLDEVDSIFDSVDTNGDGEISPRELSDHLVEKMGYSKQYTDFLFESIDTDSNGSISRDELGFAFYNFESLSMYMTFGLGGSDITQNKSFERMIARDQRDDKLRLDDLADLVFDLVDTDGSGEISEQELLDHFGKVTEKLDGNKGATKSQASEYVRSMFGSLDADQNGSLCRDELREAFGKFDFKLLARTFGLRVYQN